MNKKMLNGDQAMAYGAMVSGVKLVSSYPGSPSSGTVETLIGLAQKHNIYVEWSSNEKVAMEVGIGASIAGRRALVCTKSVGMNVMIDPLMALNLTPVHGGLVILLGDDPGGYGSQNDQDTRPIVYMLGMPMMEPATPAEGYAMMQEAYRVSERYHTAVIIRETRSYTQQSESVSVADPPYTNADMGFVREPWRFVPVPQNAVEKHRQLHQRLDELGLWVEDLPFHHMSGDGDRGIMAAGFAFRKLLDVVGEAPGQGIRLLKLGTHFPLPRVFISRFLAVCRQVLVIEENEPFLERELKAIAQETACPVEIFGKMNRHVHREGELYRWQILEALSRFTPEFVPIGSYLKENEEDEMPKRKNHCAGCTYGRILDILNEAARSLKKNPVLVGDPGCLVTVADRLDAKYAMGSAVGVADGMSRAGVNERCVALFGDSSFFHTSLPAICNAVHNRSKILMIVLDNGATATSGFQPNCGSKRDAMGRDVPALNIEEITRACGVGFVHSIGPAYLDVDLMNLFREALSYDDLALIVVRTEFNRVN